MRPRILAIIILILFVGIPLGLYWYFYIHHVAKIHFRIASSDIFHITLAGTLDYSYLPLADAVLHYDIECHSECIIGPIPPVSYTITFSASGYETSKQSYTLWLGETKEYSFIPEKKFSTEKIGSLQVDQSILSWLIESANTHSLGNFYPIGVLARGKAYVFRTQDAITEIGILTAEKFIPLFSVPLLLQEAYFDLTQKFLIFRALDNSTYISPIDEWAPVLFSPSERIQGVMQTPDGMKVRTKNNVYLESQEGWVQNPRFTDYVDIGSRYRIGYIAQSDTEKLELSNYPKWESVLVRVDRETGVSTVITRGVSIEAFIEQNGMFAYIDTSGDIWKIESYLP